MVAESGNKGHSRDFADLFFNPKAQELGDYNNIYEYDIKGFTEDDKSRCGYFISDM